ncbi:ATP-dependent protease [Bacillus phage vB_BcoS-136]|uniref:ATP-dependent Clp protease proteolytic subunit 1 n=1 Tax=Bacillus phage vB_BcoS-136 TaxID=2419619 RepID=A0A3G3BW54_9CAUD|nr:ATP-dependent protease [Bacillus phage vB_BcoS-136]AYP68301.1 ATP-dependent Clp protease proteolytic subunit 1 [Bacillus phage vB_BcoS-136]
MSENQNNQQSSTNSKKRDFILDGKVGEESVRKIAESIIEINREDEKNRHKFDFTEQPINLIINTYGGSLYDANMLIGVIESSKTPVHTYCHGKAMSAGFYIFSAGHRRFATLLATFMYHDASVGMHNTIEGLKLDLSWLEKLRDQYDAYMLSVTNLPKHIMDEKKRLKEDWYLTAQEAHGYGLVDEIIYFRKKMMV